ncbi:MULTISPECIES: DUF3107 domain-containing protein [unclassified Corynebacterium]|uniref:DUF3107 domain-containing protein n=1 Tax=unclassified Corynebacterium TaxID=2624378 RepID=UPI002A91B73C|nr:DUF3107 domain-containing protein [Corynebacterium sp.]MDY5786368.1 DUF3107 domain-containing protein [Corynebacterium sp.]
MDIKIGLAESPRELVVSTGGKQDEVLAQVTRAIENNEPTVSLSDDRGRTFLVRTERIIYVEAGAGTARTVGFTS